MIETDKIAEKQELDNMYKAMQYLSNKRQHWALASLAQAHLQSRERTVLPSLHEEQEVRDVSNRGEAQGRETN